MTNKTIKKQKIISYAEATKNLRLILCNNIIDVDGNNIIINMEHNRQEKEIEIYQYYLTDLNQGGIKFYLKKYPQLIFSYSKKLDVVVLCVDHFGTIWDYVETVEEDL